MRKILLLAITAISLNAQITLKECEILERAINYGSINKMSQNMSKFVANDCDSRMGESTREQRVQKIRDIFKGMK